MKNEAKLDSASNRKSTWQKIIALYHILIASDFIHKVAQTFITKVIVTLISIAVTVIIARILGPEGRGLYAVTMTIGTVGVQFCNLGLHASNTYYVARDRKLLPALIGNSILVSLLFGGSCAFIVGIILFCWPEIAPVHGLLLILSLAWVPFGLAYMLMQNLFIGIQEIHTYNRIELLSKILIVVQIGLLIALEYVRVESVFIAGLIALIISSVWSFGKLKRYLSGFPKPSLPLFKENIGYGFNAYLAAFFSFMVLKADLLMIQYMLGAEQVGYYSVATTMADMVYMFPVVVGTILFPKLSVINDVKEKWRLTQKAALGVGLVTILLAVAAVCLSEPLTVLLFSGQFLLAVPLFKWLMPGIAFLSIGTIFQNFLGATGNARAMVYGPLVSCLVNIMANCYLINRFGAIGASYSSTISYLLFLFITWLLTRRRYNGPS